MIAHLPLASLPNPKKVLVIGGVVHEVLKHDTAAIQVSKTYLPYMSSLLSSPRVTVFIAFQLLHDALAPGGHISTKGECLWIHLPLIRDLKKMTAAIFPIAEYAYTTTPMYPSGQNSFMVCSQDAKRNLRTPDENVHNAIFILPEFGRTMVEDLKIILPLFGKGVGRKPKKKLLLLGSGFVARPCAEYIIRDPSNELTIACRTFASSKALAADLPNATPISLNVTSSANLDAQFASHDLVISLIPYTFHTAVIKSAIKGKTRVFTTSYVFLAMRELDQQAKDVWIVILNEIGLDPGIDHLYVIKTIDEVHAKGGKIKQFLSYGGLPIPEISDNLLSYKFFWSSCGVLLALLNNASYISNSQTASVLKTELMSTAKPYFISSAFTFITYPNRDSVLFKEWYGIPEAETTIRGMLRYQGFPEFIKTHRDWLVGCNSHIISGLQWIGLFSSEKVKPRGGDLLDTLCAQLEMLMRDKEWECDLVMLQHTFIVQWKDGSEQTLTSTLEAYVTRSAVALTVSLPCGIANQLVLNGVFKAPGVQVLYTKETCDPI
ncbi:hypothetical protein PILCRDRAFT_773443 [Piloderma croceum F 1598]|uniref:PABS domain-containing protein n=1 Tax=Piloderma croceum (strain F 1598) TaxID=765440 RepID=A0A0C3G4T8_PILCF|nr:hypothetical protein PILCRDRAFT_773443 [Piloderma croceum F 1598]